MEDLINETLDTFAANEDLTLRDAATYAVMNYFDNNDLEEDTIEMEKLINKIINK